MSGTIDVKNKAWAKHCPFCGSGNVAVWDELLKCRACHKFSAAFEMDFE